MCSLFMCVTLFIHVIDHLMSCNAACFPFCVQDIMFMLYGCLLLSSITWYVSICLAFPHDIFSRPITAPLDSTLRLFYSWLHSLAPWHSHPSLLLYIMIVCFPTFVIVRLVCDFYRLHIYVTCSLLYYAMSPRSLYHHAIILVDLILRPSLVISGWLGLDPYHVMCLMLLCVQTCYTFIMIITVYFSSRAMVTYTWSDLIVVMFDLII